MNVKPWTIHGFAVACSGGYDSMAIAHFLVRGGHKPHIIHVNHGTGNDSAEAVVRRFTEKHGLTLTVHQVNPKDKPERESWEEFWRNERIKVYRANKQPVITGHNLDDAMETWLFSSMHGNCKLIPYNTRNTYRPFILNRKSALLDYAIKNGVEWAEDKSNGDVNFSRNRIRHNIMPEALFINPGFAKVISKKYLNQF
jgi:tRNA(Ile)-lysidine synthase